MARLVIDEEELWNAPIGLPYALTETVDQPARPDRSHKSCRLTIARVVGEGVIGERRRIRQHVAGGVVTETPGPAAADAEQAIAGGVDIIGQRNRRRCIVQITRPVAVGVISVGLGGRAARYSASPWGRSQRSNNFLATGESIMRFSPSSRTKSS